MAAGFAQATRWRSSRGVSVHIRGERNQGAPILLLHGIGGSAASCAQVASELAAAGHRTLSWDAPGYGDSTDPVGDLDSFGELVALVEEHASEHPDVVPLHVFGTSWGGVLALELAARRPELVASVVAADSTRGSGTSPAKARAMRARAVELGEIGPAAFAAGRAPRLVSTSSGRAAALAVEQEMARVRLPGYSAASDYMASRDLGPLLADVTAPALVIVGADDVVTGVAESRLLADGIPGAHLVVLEGAGHAALSEVPVEMTAHIHDFLAGVAR